MESTRQWKVQPLSLPLTGEIGFYTGEIGFYRKAVPKELDMSCNLRKLEPKSISHQFPGFLNGLPTIA